MHPDICFNSNYYIIPAIKKDMASFFAITSEMANRIIDCEIINIIKIKIRFRTIVNPSYAIIHDSNIKIIEINFTFFKIFIYMINLI